MPFLFLVFNQKPFLSNGLLNLYTQMAEWISTSKTSLFRIK